MLDGLSFSWSWNPISLLAILLLCALYLLGVRSLRRREPAGNLPRRRQFAWFGLAILCLVLVTLTPIDTIARTQLFSAHMVQVLLISTLAVPFLLLACPHEMVTPLLEKPVWRRAIVALTHPVVASLLFNLTFLAWHMPPLYNRAQPNPWLYQVEIWTLFLVALVNWWPLVGPVDDVRGLSYPIKMLYAFLDGLPLEIFAFILVYSGVVLYPLYKVPASLQVLPFGDQAAGGALLMIPGLIDLIVMTPLFFRWIAQIDHQARIDDERRASALAALEAEEDEEDEEEVESSQLQGS